jgi:predicted nucleic acid-binding protein
MNERLFVDTSAWFAFANRSDPDHRAVKAVLTGGSSRIVTSNFVFDETVTLCASRLGHGAASKIGAALREARMLDLVRVASDDEARAWTLFLERPDKQYSFTDCTSFVLMRRLSLRRAVALDDDFAQEGFATVP